MSVDLSEEVARMLDERAITKVLFQYTRGADQCDVDLIRKSYHPDATDPRGEGGSAMALCDTLAVRLSKYKRTMHCLTNIDIEVDGDVAAVSSYIRSHHLLVDSEGRNVTIERNGQFVDRFERRNGEWRIAHREGCRVWTEQRFVGAETWDGPSAPPLRELGVA